MSVLTAHLFCGWIGVLAGVISGMAMGIFFKDESWLGGYNSYRRRMLRLGHIACFGIGFLNFMLALTIISLPEANIPYAASVALFAVQLLMPLTCFAAAWDRRCHALFPIPALYSLYGVGAVLLAII